MVLSALSSLRIQGKSTIVAHPANVVAHPVNVVAQPWFVDYGASNHMTGSLKILHNFHTYNGTQNIKFVDGNTLSIYVVGEMNSSFRYVFTSHGIVSNLILVGQLVDDNCSINFSHDGCSIQDQASRKVIARGPKMGRLFPIQFSIPRILSFVCSSGPNKFEDCHKKSGHPNFPILSHLLKNKLLNYKSSLSNSSFDCSVCKLVLYANY